VKNNDPLKKINISPSWSHKLVRRSSELIMHRPHKLEKYRQDAMTYSNIYPFFTMLKYVWVKEDFCSDLFYNFDETGINLSDNRSEHVVCIVGDKYSYIKAEERIKNITLCFMINCNGHSLPPAILWPSSYPPDEANIV
jgi:hypothetical protein